MNIMNCIYLIVCGLVVCGGCRYREGGQAVCSETTQKVYVVEAPEPTLFESAMLGDDDEALKTLAQFYLKRLKKTQKQEDLCLAAYFHMAFLYEKECDENGERTRVIEPWSDLQSWQDAQRLFNDYAMQYDIQIELEAPFQLRYAAAAVGAQNALIDLRHYYKKRFEKTGIMEDFWLSLFFAARLIDVENGLEKAITVYSIIPFYRQYTTPETFSPRLFHWFAEEGSYSLMAEASQDLGLLLLEGKELCVHGLAICHLRFAAARGFEKAQKELNARKIPWQLDSKDSGQDIETYLEEESLWQPENKGNKNERD